ncbi:MAG: D-lyxose/D-mannose family sugar isomerase [Anaerolineae bacterium]|nr:D-lyxose/D-mannose family sugar isomerase [Anaerolineae bacterium]
MKRSEINMIMQAAMEFVRERQFYLPPFAYWTPEDWRGKGNEVRDIVAYKLGWDITDFGRGNFHKTGLLMFTLRNGPMLDRKPAPDERHKPYAEKILIVEEGQITPMHFHWSKMEDIINRGGGNLVIQVYNATEDEDIADSDVIISVDSAWRTVPAGSKVVLTPGESITLPQYNYHQFWAEGGKVLAGEVSTVNDDDIDNRFHHPTGRFPMIEEDEAPLYLLCTDYTHYYK